MRCPPLPTARQAAERLRTRFMDPRIAGLPDALLYQAKRAGRSQVAWPQA